MNLMILVTGGTFDKEYNEINGELFFKDTHVAEMLKLGRSRVNVTIRTVMMIDSLHMSKDERDLIAKNCQKAKESKIIITHGTDTMIETAKVIAKSVENKCIVLVGAMVPYAFGSSDGLFNLGSAVAFAQSLDNGVYIAMNGKYFHGNNCRKNKKTGEFEGLR